MMTKCGCAGGEGHASGGPEEADSAAKSGVWEQGGG